MLFYEINSSLGGRTLGSGRARASGSLVESCFAALRLHFHAWAARLGEQGGGSPAGRAGRHCGVLAAAPRSQTSPPASCFALGTAPSGIACPAGDRGAGLSGC